MSVNAAYFLRRAREDQSGQGLILVGVLLVIVFAMAGMSVDVGYALELRRELQASTDAAALAAAQDLPDSNQAITTANNYSSITGGKNSRSNHPAVTMSSGYPQTKCLTTTGGDCNPVNAIVVKQQTSVPLFFARVVGWSSFTMSAVATAARKGGVPKPLDIMLVLDTTASMNSSCSGSVSGVSNPTRLDCALAGVRALLSGLWPCGQGVSGCGTSTAVDQVGLSVFPGLKQSSAISKESDCSNNMSSSDVANYNASPIYTLSGLSNSFRTSSTSGLNGANSTIVKQVDWGDGNGCSSSAYGVESPGGVGTYFADAITQAQATLNATGRSNTQDVIIVLSDGDATYSGVSSPCHKAITAAQNATAQGTWMYSIAYGASTSSSNSCNNDSPAISAYSTMQRLASDPSKFYNQPSAGSLTTIFNQIMVSLSGARLVPDDTP